MWNGYRYPWSAGLSSFSHGSCFWLDHYYSYWYDIDGDEEKRYAGIPAEWDAKPYVWMPGAISYHFVERYIEYLELLSQKKLWVNRFKDVNTIDNDDYDEPPDDWYMVEEEEEAESNDYGLELIVDEEDERTS